MNQEGIGESMLNKLQDVVDFICINGINLKWLCATPKNDVFVGTYPIRNCSQALVAAIFNQISEDSKGVFIVHCIRQNALKTWDIAFSIVDEDKL